MSLDVGVLYRDHATKVWRYVRARVPSDADAEDVTSEVPHLSQGVTGAALAWTFWRFWRYDGARNDE